MTERNRALFVPQIDLIVNDLSLPFWAAIPHRAQPRQLAIAAAETLDERLASYPPTLLEEVYAEQTLGRAGVAPGRASG